MSLPLTRFALSAAFVALCAQWLPAQGATAATGPGTTMATSGEPSTGRVVAGALLGGTAGVLVGGLTGFYIGGNRCGQPGNSDSCYGIQGLAVGSVVGFTIGTPVGAHVLNRRRGALTYSLLASTALAAAGFAILRSADLREPGYHRTAVLSAVVITVPILQIVTATIIERRSNRR